MFWALARALEENTVEYSGTQWSTVEYREHWNTENTCFGDSRVPSLQLNTVEYMGCVEEIGCVECTGYAESVEYIEHDAPYKLTTLSTLHTNVIWMCRSVLRLAQKTKTMQIKLHRNIIRRNRAD